MCGGGTISRVLRRTWGDREALLVANRTSKSIKAGGGRAPVRTRTVSYAFDCCRWTELGRGSRNDRCTGRHRHEPVFTRPSGDWQVVRRAGRPKKRNEPEAQGNRAHENGRMANDEWRMRAQADKDCWPNAGSCVMDSIADRRIHNRPRCTSTCPQASPCLLRHNLIQYPLKSGLRPCSSACLPSLKSLV
jgi:hypothetical protein